MVFRFEDVEVDDEAFELRREGRAVPIRRLVLETLIFFVQERHRLITREDLLAGPWAGAAVTDAALSQVIMATRRALGDAGERCIVTVRGKGFRFAPPVQVLKGSWRDSDDADGSTIPDDAQREGEAPVPPDALALVVAWCQGEPERVGEALVFPSDGGERVYGRGDDHPNDPYPRARLFQLRPGVVRPAPPLANRKISRVQVFVRSDEGGSLLEVQNLGLCPLVHEDRSVSVARLRPGETVRLGTQVLFVCVKRPAWIPRVFGGFAPFNFGSSDENGLVGESPAMWQLRDRIRRVAARAGHVRLIGGTAEERELVARAIHANSPRAAGPFVAVDGSAEGRGRGENWPEQATVFLSGLRCSFPSPSAIAPRFIVAANADAGGCALPTPALDVTLPEMKARREDVPMIIGHLLCTTARVGQTLCQPPLELVEGIMREGSVPTTALIQERKRKNPDYDWPKSSPHGASRDAHVAEMDSPV